MNYIDITLMSTPQTYLCGMPVCFPYQKAEALFYYVAVEKTVTRDQAAEMFWSNLSEDSAKQNIRQTLYVLKKAFSKTVIKSMPNHQLCLSDAFTIRCDLDDFYEKRELSLYKGEIFNGFYMRNTARFEEWLLKKRESARAFFLSNYLEYMRAVPAGRLDILENYFNRYVREDPYDERAYVIMLKAYLKNGLYYKGIQLYQKLCALLNKEMGAEPSNEPTALYHQLLNTRTVSGEYEFKADSAPLIPPEQKHESNGLIYREQLKQLGDIYSEYLSGKGRAVLLSGESGIGKSFLLNEFLDANIPKDALVIKITCYMKNKELMLQPWNDLMLQIHKYVSEKRISIPHALVNAANRLIPAFGVKMDAAQGAGGTNYNYLASQNSILQILLLIARKTRLVILFGNIHAMDALSLDMLTNLVHTARQEILILCTSLDIVDRDTESFISATHNNWQLTRIHLPPMLYGEAEGFIRAELGSAYIEDAQIREIYKLSQGNRFFIRELLYNVKNGRPLDEFSSRAQAMLNDQLNGLGEPARQILDVISVFSIYIVLDELCFIQNESAVEVTRILEQLKGRGLILEKIIEDRVCFAFAHLRMRDFIYGKIHPARKRRLHELAGLACENVSAFNLEKEYHLMVRHYSLAGNYAKALQYKIQKLSGDMFEDYQSFVDFEKEANSGLSPQEYLKSLLDELAAVREQQPEALDYDRLEAILLLSESRCCLLSGEVETGIAAYKKLIDRQYAWNNPQLLFKAYLQLLDYIVLNGGSGILICMEKEYERAKATMGPFEKAAFQQLQALAALLGGDKDKARYLLSAVTMRILEKKE